ncbi:MAG: UDP-N-acetylmuramoyl-L-alanyl-D-glutamate--2,6-diaminopimelate ligase [Rickettsiaceae bacterium]|nr:UDP-N-acetylmuramoyl-L-alanyl-D-glutamate--2,6-diaminopimelate ligase [Rickettsiaceae bacterium]
MTKSNIYKRKPIGVSDNSRKIKQGYIFVAIKGETHDGNDYIEQAFENGAILALSDDIKIVNKLKGKFNITFVEDARKMLADLTIIFGGKKCEKILAVTGTNGKSSVVHYIGQLSSLCGKSAASIGTLGVNRYFAKNAVVTKSNNNFNINLTTPAAQELEAILCDLKAQNIDLCALEASSIGLDQERLRGRIFASIGFTNFSQDHLDYHHTMGNYLNAKLKIFVENMNENSVAVINAKIKEYDIIQNLLKKHKRKYISLREEAQGATDKETDTYTNLAHTSDTDFKYKIMSQNQEHQRFMLYNYKCEFIAQTNILGSYQIENIIMAMLMLKACGFDLSELVKFVPLITPPPGRLERVANIGIGARIFIDYAHTPESLERALLALKHIATLNSGKLICIFGCGGDRDKSKRKLMGKIASEIADIIIVTDDNPRNEDAQLIRNDILSGCKSSALEIGNRKEAIKYGVGIITDHDILIIAGKGHEEYQIIGQTKFPFSDKHEAINALEELL